MYPPSHSLTLAHERQDYLRSGGSRSPRTGTATYRTPWGSVLRRVLRHQPRPEARAEAVLASGGP